MTARNSDSFISEFKQLYLSDLQKELKYVQPSEFGSLYDRYKLKHSGDPSKEYSKKTIEQILIALPLWILSQDRPDDMSETQYIRTMHEIGEELKILHGLAASFGS